MNNITTLAASLEPLSFCLGGVFFIILVTAGFALGSNSKTSQDTEDREGEIPPHLQVFDGTLAIDPADVLAVSIVDEKENGCFDAELGWQTAKIITFHGSLNATENAGKALLQSISASASPVTSSEVTAVTTSAGNAAI